MNKKKMIPAILSSLVVLSPMAVGAILWSKLPDEIATTFELNGDPKDYSTKGFVVFVIPLFILVCHLLCTLRGKLRSTGEGDIGPKIMRWLCPIISVLVGVEAYGNALGFNIDSTLLLQLFMGAMILIIGIIMPKCSQASRIGFKLPWTLRSEENWNATHRRAGKLWIVCGVCMIIDAFALRGDPNGMTMFILLLILAIVLPIIYSMNHARKQKVK